MRSMGIFIFVMETRIETFFFFFGFPKHFSFFFGFSKH